MNITCGHYIMFIFQGYQRVYKNLPMPGITIPCILVIINLLFNYSQLKRYYYKILSWVHWIFCSCWWLVWCWPWWSCVYKRYWWWYKSTTELTLFFTQRHTNTQTNHRPLCAIWQSWYWAIWTITNYTMNLNTI